MKFKKLLHSALFLSGLALNCTNVDTSLGNNSDTLGSILTYQIEPETKTDTFGSYRVQLECKDGISGFIYIKGKFPGVTRQSAIASYILNKNSIPDYFDSLKTYLVDSLLLPIEFYTDSIVPALKSLDSKLSSLSGSKTENPTIADSIANLLLPYADSNGFTDTALENIKSMCRKNTENFKGQISNMYFVIPNSMDISDENSIVSKNIKNILNPEKFIIFNNDNKRDSLYLIKGLDMHASFPGLEP